MTDRKYLTEPELAAAVKQLRIRAGTSQAAIATAMNVSQGAVSQAENFRDGDSMLGLRLRIYEHLTGRKPEGPFYAEEADKPF